MGMLDITQIPFSDPHMTVFKKLLESIDPATGQFYMDHINEKTSGHGIVLDTDLLVKDNTITGRKESYAVCTALTLTAADSGKVFDTAGASAVAIVLPPAAAGLNFKFICSATNNNAITVTTSDTTDTSGELFYGGVLFTDTDTLAGLLAVGANISQILLDDNATNAGFAAGSCIEIIGTAAKKWFVTGQIMTGTSSSGAGIFVNAS